LLRQGLQECEARIFIEKVLSDPAARAKLNATLVDQCESLLNDRMESMRQGGFDGWAWFVSSGWNERNEQLFELAGAISKAMP